MGTRNRRSFRPHLGSPRLEGRLVLSGLAPAVVSAAATNAQGANPSITVKVRYVQAAYGELRSAYSSFENATLQAGQSAINALSAGQNEANLVAALRSTISLQGGILEARLLQISNRFALGVPDLYNAAPGTVAASRARNARAPVVDPSTFVPADQRLKVQADNLINGILANTTSLQAASSVDNPMSSARIAPAIEATYLSSRVALTRFLKGSVQNRLLFTF